MSQFPRATIRIAVAIAVCLPAVGWAQTSSPAASSRGKWEIEVHVGGAIAGGSTGGTTGALPTGEVLTTGTGFPSLRVSSWLFGDGTALFNSASGLAGRPERISALDDVLTSPSVRRRSGATFGFRMTRALATRLDAEFSLDYAASGLALTEASVAQVEKSRQSFVTAFDGLFSSAPALYSNRTTSATSSLKKSAGERLFVSGGVRMYLSTGRRHTYLVGGVAMARSTSASPGATINGSYKFTNIVAVPFTISESDDLSIRFGSSVSLLGMAGGGFDLASWTRSGIRVDARVFLGMDKIETVLDAQGTPHEATPTGANFTFTSPAIQWSNDQTGIGRSSLSGTVTGYTTLTGTHFQAPVLVTVGYFFRF